MISSHALFTVYELYFLNNQQFGFYMTNAAPRSYVQVVDFGKVIDDRWISVKPGAISPEEARRRGLSYLAIRYDLNTNECIGTGLHIHDSDRGWSRYQPDL
ncbi:MAG: hypothetical protein CMN80_10635 [Spongiibacter sp.]|uniref:hypothetical protein n=1 Tax=Spongiibacter TaxID=630749 RepID=UPI000C0A922E|nr:hypothetical protein [Spongiibacter sp.]MAK44594.1 hypothetical protein [Spongiibacter sp.]